MGNLRGWELLIILLLVVILFGAKKLPEAARGIGRSLRIFKAETKTLSEENNDDETPQVEAARPAPAPLQQQAHQVEPAAQPAQPVVAPQQQAPQAVPGQPQVSGSDRPSA